MSEFSASRRTLFLITEGLSEPRLEELRQLAERSEGKTEILKLTEANAPQALEKIFAADATTVWSELIDEKKI